MEDVRVPYPIPVKHLSLLNRAVAEQLEEGNKEYAAVGDELGIAKTRQNTSKIKTLMPSLFGDKNIIIHLTDDERDLLLNLVNTPEIVRCLNHEL